jgi:hypothetical protein
MTFNSFIKNFKITNDIGNDKIQKEILKNVDDDFITCINELGGKTFNEGLYRVFRGDQILKASENIIRVFQEANNSIIVFGYDWLGRHYAVDNENVENGKKLILMLEPGAGEAMSIPVPILDFHNSELISCSEEALSVNFFKKWKKLNPESIAPDKCIGYKIPLFLGGRDIIDNLELIDLEVYIDICGQLRNKISKLKNGQTIKDIIIK